MSYEDLPALNATLNGTSAVLALAGFVCIKRRWIAAHKALMLSAVAASACFLTSYLIYHFGPAPLLQFKGTGVARIAYFTMLISHVILAIAIVPMILRVVYLGLRGRLAQHVRLARWTLPLWTYVSVTGVVIYIVLYML